VQAQRVQPAVPAAQVRQVQPAVRVAQVPLRRTRAVTAQQAAPRPAQQAAQAQP
jgi:hypothetical protein